jgi:hypothetical protein
MLWIIATFGTLLAAMFISSLVKNSNNQYFKKITSIEQANAFSIILIENLEKSYSFFEIVDSKLMGLLIFMISNYYTGALNLLIETRSQSSFVAFLLIILNCFVFTFIPFYINYYLKFLRNPKQLKTKQVLRL